MRYRTPSVSKAAVVVGLLSASVSHIQAENRPIDAGRSTLTVLVSKSGLFSAFADNHVINAPIAGGTISEDAPLSIDVTVRAADLRVLDPGLSVERRAEVQARMLGPEVLDIAKFPEIAFVSIAIEPTGTDRWQVTGRLTLHGQSRTTTFSVVRVNNTYSGEVAIKQREFGIEPIRVAGGTVKVKDELKVRFEIAR
jgi:polyisoprenoid-binding protein YceI